MDFMKVDPDITLNAKIRAAGDRAGWMFVAILGVNAHGSRDGRIPPQEATPEYLAWRANQTLPVAKKSLARCVDAGLVRLEADGTLVLPGYDDPWRPAMTAAERQKLWRKRRKIDAGDDDVTERDGPSSQSNDGRRQKDGGSDRRNDRHPAPTRRPKGAGAERSREGKAKAEGRSVSDAEETRRIAAERDRRFEERSNRERELRDAATQVFSGLRIVERGAS